MGSPTNPPFRDEPSNRNGQSAAGDGVIDRQGGPKLLDRVRMTARTVHLARSTERAYVSWIRQYILFHGKRHPASLREADVSRCSPRRT